MMCGLVRRQYIEPAACHKGRNCNLDTVNKPYTLSSYKRRLPLPIASGPQASGFFGFGRFRLKGSHTIQQRQDQRVLASQVQMRQVERVRPMLIHIHTVKEPVPSRSRQAGPACNPSSPGQRSTISGSNYHPNIRVRIAPRVMSCIKNAYVNRIKRLILKRL